jgi:hypothetical protein
VRRWGLRRAEVEKRISPLWMRTRRSEAPGTAVARERDLLDGEVDGRGLDDRASGGSYVNGVGAGGEAVRIETVGVDSAAPAATEQAKGGESKEQGEDAPAAGAARKEDEEQAGQGDFQARGSSGARREDARRRG